MPQTMSAKTLSDPKNLDWLQIVQKQVAGIQFGFVQITVHNGDVVQIERTEKIRVENSRSMSGINQQAHLAVKPPLQSNSKPGAYAPGE